MREIFKKIKSWTLILLLWEFVLFLWNLPSYLRQFFRGLRVFSASYSGLLDAMKELKESREVWFEGEKDPQKATENLRKYINEVIRLEKEHERMFTALFGVLIAILALIISVVVLFVSRG